MYIMAMKIAGIEWDEGNVAKCQKHGVSVAEIERVLFLATNFGPDVKHSLAEQRFVVVGRTEQGRALFVAFTFRHYGAETYMRPVSARYMHKKEAVYYEKANPNHDNR